MAGKIFSFNATELEVAFFRREISRTNSNPTKIIRGLIQNAMEGRNIEDQIEILKSELGEIKKLVKLAAESATFAKYMATANYDESVQSNRTKVEEMKKATEDLTKEEMEGI